MKLPTAKTLSALIALLTLCSIVEAQEAKKVPRIRYLSLGSGFGVNDEPFLQGLRQLGYIEGQNIMVEWRFVDANLSNTMISPLSLLALKLMPL